MADVSQIILPGGETPQNIKALKISYGDCSTAAATAAKTITIKSDNGSIGNNAPFVLEAGAVIVVKFTVTNAAASPTLNVNGTGAKAIKYRNADLTSPSLLAANRIYQFVYDGTYWQLVGDLDTDTNISYVIDSGVLKMQYSSAAARDNLYQITYDDVSEGLDFYMT